MADRITDKLVKSLSGPDKGNIRVYDTEVSGFGIRVTSGGSKSFVLNYRVGGRERRITIGKYPDWSVAAAREEARRLKRDVNLGLDPMGGRHSDRAAPSVKYLAERYMDEHAVRKVERAQADDLSMIKKLILPAIGTIKVHEVTHGDIDALHRAITKNKPIRANRMGQLLSKMFSLSIRWGYRLDNPVAGLQKNPEERRNRFLSVEEIERLSNALLSHPNRQSANIVRFLMLTGARRGEVLNAEWNQFDLDRKAWIKPSSHTKQKKEHRVPLSDPAIEILETIRSEQDEDQLYVFPGKSGEQPVQDIKKFWASVCEQANIRDVRIHDLRHTYASILASQGMSLQVIGALLGHTQPSTTARYSHFYDDPLREATDRVGVAISGE